MAPGMLPSWSSSLGPGGVAGAVRALDVPVQLDGAERAGPRRGEDLPLLGVRAGSGSQFRHWPFTLGAVGRRERADRIFAVCQSESRLGASSVSAWTAVRSPHGT